MKNNFHSCIRGSFLIHSEKILVFFFAVGKTLEKRVNNRLFDHLEEFFSDFF